MSGSAIQLLLFTAKTLIIVLFILLLVAGILALLTSGKQKTSGKIKIKNLNKKYNDTTEELCSEIMPKKQFKQYSKDQKLIEKTQKKIESPQQPNVFVLDFDGDMKASAVEGLREEVTAILGVAKPQDEVVVCLESGGGMVHAYGLAASQLQRIRENKITLTIIVDKVAASGGYLMASVGNKILAAPFAIIGSIGVVVQLPNFNRLLKDKKIDFEQLTAGNFKRTLTLFGHNTEEGREKLQEEIESIHSYFKEAIQHNRPEINIEQVATGEHWLASQALDYKLVDGLTTSDDYLLKRSKEAQVYKISYTAKKSFLSRFIAASSLIKKTFFEKSTFHTY